MFCRRLVLITLVFATIASPASADWQYTDWGMSPEQVVRAAPGSVSLMEPERDGTSDVYFKSAGDYSAGQLSFRATFGFRDDKLVKVVLQDKTKSDFVKLNQLLSRRYGTPHFDSAPLNVVWHDREDSNVVSMLCFHEMELEIQRLELQRYGEVRKALSPIIITYQPLETDESQGL